MICFLEELLTEEDTKRVAGLMCYRCKHDGKPVYGAKGGGDSLIHKPKTTWWHPHGDYMTECHAAEIWTDHGK